MKVESIFNLNGDRALSWIEKFIYFLVNYCRNCVGGFTRLQCLQKFKPTEVLQRPDSVPKSVSPSRRVSDYFWMSIDYDAITWTLKSNVRIFDIGCGTGRYYTLLNDQIGRAMASYKGIDLSRRHEWKDIEINNSNVCFVVDDAKMSFAHLADENLIISQSALEHIEHDQATIIRLCAVLSEKRYPAIQIHLVPASHALFSYLLHGFRQYNKRRLKQIKSELEEYEDVRCEVFALGGWRGFVTHLKWFTLARRKSIFEYSYRQRNKYESECKEAVRKDCESDSRWSPEFFALVVYIGTKDSIKLK